MDEVNRVDFMKMKHMVEKFSSVLELFIAKRTKMCRKSHVYNFIKSKEKYIEKCDFKKRPRARKIKPMKCK